MTEAQVAPTVQGEDEALPLWAQALKRKYEAGEASQFLLYGNVVDYVPFRGQWLWPREFLTQALTGGKQIVAYYNLSEGLSFASEQMRKEFGTFLEISSKVTGGLPGLDNPDLYAQRPDLLKDPRLVLPILERLIETRDRVVILIDHVEKIIPATQLSFMSVDDRRNLATLQRWAVHPKLLSRDCVVLLITKNLADVHQDLRSGNPLLVPIEISFPDATERLNFLREAASKVSSRTEAGEAPPALAVSDEQLATLTAGFNRVSINALFQQARRSGKAVTEEGVKQRKEEIFREEYGGLVEVMDPDFGLESVAGLKLMKEDLQAVIELLRQGKAGEAPMGVGFIGPPGTGKTMLAKAIAKGTNLPFLRIGNLRDKFVGESEKNADVVLTLLRSLAPVVVFVDEMDQAYGARGERGDSGVSQRMWAKFAEVQSDTSFRGRILWIWATNRPDLIDEATKRPGRLGDLKIPFFFACDAPEDVLRLTARRNNIELPTEGVAEVVEKLRGYSAAEIEAVTLQSRWFARRAGRAAVAVEDLQAAVEDYIPSRNEKMIEFMEILALLESSSMRYLPERYASAYDRAELFTRAQLLRAELTAQGLL